MYLKETEQFYYKNGNLYCEQVAVEAIAASVGTPVYIYSKKYFQSRARQFNKIFSSLPHRVFYAVKSNYNINVIRTICSEGLGADVNSGGELYRALKAGVSSKNIIFAGVGKSDDEIRYAMGENILMFKIESPEEAAAIQTIAAEAGKTVSAALRVNPDVDAGTHPHISTALAENKFGMTFDDAMSVYTSSAFPNIHFIGVDMHLGSQILAIDPYLEACDKVLSFIDTLKSRGIQIHHFDLGGGYGVDYSDDEPMDMELLAKKLSAQMRSRDIELFFEPGRWITANGGILAARVLYNKANGPKNFIVTDAAMTELLRPALYSAYHHIQPVRSFEGREEKTYDVVGPVCESGDRLAKDRSLTNPERGELLAVLSCGSYASVMGSNYNARLKPPEVIVDGAAYVIARRRESIFDTLKNEKF